MSQLVNSSFDNIITNLLNNYERIMMLKLFVDSDDENLKYTYINAANNHNNKIMQDPEHIDAGFDLFAPGNNENDNDSLHFSGLANKLDLKVCCSARMVTDSRKSFNTGYYWKRMVSRF